jgi:hypothetical protein
MKPTLEQWLERRRGMKGIQIGPFIRGTSVITIGRNRKSISMITDPLEFSCLVVGWRYAMAKRLRRMRQLLK